MTNFNNLYEQLDRMVDLINYSDGSYNEDHPGILYEGLIKTTSLGAAKVMLNRWFRDHNIPDYYGAGLEKRTVEFRQDDTLSVYILDIINNKELIDKLLTYINNLGYQSSLVLSKKNGNNENDKQFSKNYLFSFVGKQNELEYIFLILEAKFDIEIDDNYWPDKLYHITRQDVLDKIKRIGITPRTESKKSTHEERVYFAKNYENAKLIYKRFKEDYLNQKFAILEINPKLVKHLRLFDDPNFKTLGYYGLVNVPPNAIKILDENI